MTAPHFGVKYPDGRYSGPITTSRRDAAHYGKPFHAEVYEVGTAEDPTPRHQREAEPWDFGEPIGEASSPKGDGRAAG
jgi:hypothetical protein